MILGSLFWQKVLFIFVVLAAVLVAVDELIRVFHTGGAEMPGSRCSPVRRRWLVAAYFGGPLALLVAMAITVLATIFWRMPGGSVGFVRDVTTGDVPDRLRAVAGRVRDPAGAAGRDGPGRVVTFFLVVVASDVGGYVGRGAVRQAPDGADDQPEEVLGGLRRFDPGAVSAPVSASVVWLLDGNWWVGAIVGAVAVLTATVGDLAESMIKRDLGIKDMSNLLPGHGGVMDRLDSLLATAPAVWLLLHLLV